MTPTETPPPAPATDDTPRAGPPTASPERLKRFHELAARHPTTTWDDLLGVGEDWWTDEEFEQMLEFLRRSRKDLPR